MVSGGSKRLRLLLTGDAVCDYKNLIMWSISAVRQGEWDQSSFLVLLEPKCGSCFDSRRAASPAFMAVLGSFLFSNLGS